MADSTARQLEGQHRRSLLWQAAELVWDLTTRSLRPSAWVNDFRALRQLSRGQLLNNFKALIAPLAIYYIALMPLVAMPLYNTMIFHPSKAGNFQALLFCGLPIQHVWFSSRNGTKLYGWLIEKPGATKIVLISHGNAGNLTHRGLLAKDLLDCGASVFLYDYAGYGLSEGSCTLPGLVDDGVGAFDYLVHEKKFNPDNIIVMGESLGTGVACQIAGCRKCSKVILQSAYTSIRELGKLKLLFLNLYPSAMFPPEILDSVPIIIRTHRPLLILHGARDRLIPLSNAKALFSQAIEPKQMTILPHAGHNDMNDMDRELYRSTLTTFLNQTNQL